MFELTNIITFFKYLSIPLISAFIGWITNVIAIKMLFYPRRPRKIIFFTIQGIFPKNKKRIATKLGNVVQRDLINFNDIKGKLKDGDSLDNVKEEIAIKVDEVLRGRLEKMKISNIVPEQIVKSTHKAIVSQIERELPNFIDTALTKVESKLNIHDIVVSKVENFSDEKLERMLLDITAKEFKFVEVLGGVLGFIIGIFQLIMSLFYF
ncbi:MAG: DUF445 family protein [Chitinophagales bacterium]|nr:DUF445 family protein [Chitinophagales bacterium]